MLPVDEDTDLDVDVIYALTGDPLDSTIYGGLWYSTSPFTSWTQAFDQDDGIAAFGRIHPCDNNFDEPARAGGHLLARDAMSHNIFVGSHAVGDEGVYMIEEATLTECALTGIPAGSLTSALALGEGASGETLLLVGLKGGDGATSASLYTCAVDSANCATPVSCTAVSDADAVAIDVRDIQVDVLDPTVAYIADGGRFDSSGTCDYNDGATWEWDVVGDTLGNVTDNLEPPLTGCTSGVSSYDIVTSEVVGVSMDPDGSYLFAYFPGGQDAPYQRVSCGSASNAKVWRADMSTLGTGGANDWEGLQGTDSTAYSDRREVVGGLEFLAAGADPGDEVFWIDDQLGRETWAPAYGVDGVFWDDDGSAATPEVMMVTDGFGVWLVDATDQAWADVDDDVVWTFWFDSANTGNLPQTTVANGIAEGPSGVVYGAYADIGAGWWDPTGTRGAEVPCYFDRLDAHGRAVDVPGETASGDIVWLAMGDEEGSAAIIHSDDGGANWCVQTTADSLTNGNVTASPYYGLACKGETTDREPSCGGSGHALDDFGAPSDIAGLPDDLDLTATGSVAFATFESDRCGNSGEDPCTDAGLKVTLDGGASWVHVADRDLSEATYGGSEACSYDTFFAVRSEIAIDPKGSKFTSSSDYEFRLYLTGESNTDSDSDGTYDCGLVEVVFDDTDLSGGEFQADWTDIVIPNACKIDGGNLSGVRVNPWMWQASSADRLLVWGAWDSRSGTPWGGVCSITRTGTDPVGIVSASASTSQFDIDDVLAHPWMDRVLFVQPSVKAVTWQECGTSCSKPIPLVVESLRDLGSPNFTWQPTHLSTEGLQGLRGADLEFGGDGSVERLYYAGSGSGAHRSTEISDATW